MTLEQTASSLHHQLAAAYIAAWNSHDVEAILDLHTHDTVFTVHQSGAPAARGRAQCRDAFAYLLDAWPDQRFKVVRIDAAEWGYTCQSSLTGRLAMPWSVGPIVVEPSATPKTFEILDVMRCTGGRIARKDVWLDSAGLIHGASVP